MELVQVAPEDLLQAQVQGEGRLGQIPGHVAQLPGELLPVQGVALEQVLFHQIDALAGLAAQAHDAVEQHLILAQSRIQGGHGLFLVVVGGQGFRVFHGQLVADGVVDLAVLFVLAGDDAGLHHAGLAHHRAGGGVGGHVVADDLLHPQLLGGEAEGLGHSLGGVAPVPPLLAQHVGEGAAFRHLVKAQQLEDADDAVVLLQGDGPAVEAALLVSGQGLLDGSHALADVLVGFKEQVFGHLAVGAEALVVVVKIVEPDPAQIQPGSLQFLKFHKIHGCIPPFPL